MKNVISKRIDRYINISFIATLILYIMIGLCVEVKDKGLVLWQVLTSFSFIYLCKIGSKLNIRSVYLLIFIYQLFFSYCLFAYNITFLNTPFGYNAVDSILYSNLANFIRFLNFKDSWNYLYNYFGEYSDLGFPIYLRFIYKLANGNIINAFNLLILFNCIFQVITVIITYKLASLHIGKTKRKWVILLWGLNSASIYFNVSGLKEPLFLMICMLTMLSIYKLRYHNSLFNFTITLLLITILYLFRSYVSIFFLFILLGFIFFRLFYEKYFSVICLSIIILCIFLTELLVAYFPELYYAIMHNNETYNSSGVIFQWISYILAFLSPIPKFYEIITPQNLITLTYSIVKFFFSIYAFYSVWNILKTKETKFYPLITISLFQFVLLIVSGHTIDYRYPYITMPCFYILMVEGFTYNYKTINKLYFIFSILIIIIFNLRAY